MLKPIEFIKVAELLSRYYPASYPKGSPRKTHGMDHATRAALFGCAAYGLMTLSQSHGTDQLSFEERERECRLVCIALLMHDSARQNDGPDLWDEASALNLFSELTPHIEPNLAKIVAEAMANKDWKADKEYAYLDIDEPVPRFVKTTRSHSVDPQTERLRLAIQFGDCIDIFRPSLSIAFDWTYIDLYRETQNIQLKEVIEELLPECFELIDKTEAQKISENWSADKLHEHVFQEFNRDNQQAYPLLQSLFEPKKDFSFEQLPLTTDPIVRAFIQKNLLFRGVTNPMETYSRGKNEKPKQYSLTRAAYEIYKTERRENTPTEARTESKRLGKHGNINRSVSLMGQGASLYADVGGGIFIDLTKMIDASRNLLGTGTGRKHCYDQASRGNVIDLEPKLETIRTHMLKGKMHGFSGWNTISEILADIDHWDCIMYCVDKTIKFKNNICRRFLEAVHLRKAYLTQFKNTEPLPVYEFCIRTGACKKISVTEESIMTAFVTSFYEDIQQMSRAPKNKNEMDFILNENLDIHEVFEYLYGNSLLKDYTEDFKLRIIARLKNDNSKIVRAIENTLMEELTQRPSNDHEHLYYMTKLTFQIERGIELSDKNKLELDCQLECFFDRASTYLSSPWVDIYAQIAKHTEAKSIFLQNFRSIPPRRFNDYLRLMSIVSPETVDDIDLVKMTREYIQKRVEEIQKYKKGPLLSIKRCIEEYGPVSFGPYYSEEMHQQILDTLKKEEQVLLLRPLREFLEHYTYEESLFETNFNLACDIMDTYAHLYSKPLPSTELIIKRIIFSGFIRWNESSRYQSNMDMLIKIHQEHPETYAAIIEKTFKESMGEECNDIFPFNVSRDNFNKIINIDTLLHAMKVFTKDTETQHIDLLCTLVFKVVERKNQIKSDDHFEECSNLSIEDFLDTLVNSNFGDFYTQDVHKKLMAKLESMWNKEISRIFGFKNTPVKLK